ncbi:MAG TPA: hypothetical protein DIW47_15345 [Bacteroidetes bacterium]|nr:hypothetical protein [Bacteroidota bacterium]
MALDYLKMTLDLHSVPNTYTVKVSFNGLPLSNVSNLAYMANEKYYKAENIQLGVTKTFSHTSTNPASHLQPYEADEVILIKENDTLQLRGGGIIKTTHYPPPYNRKEKYTYENSGILNQVYLSELTIESDGSGNYTLSGKVKLKPGQTSTFQINPAAALTTGFSGRSSEVLEIHIEPGSLTEATFSGITLDNNDIDETTPCTVIIHTGNQLDFNNSYLKSAWFFIKD